MFLSCIYILLYDNLHRHQLLHRKYKQKCKEMERKIQYKYINNHFSIFLWPPQSFHFYQLPESSNVGPNLSSRGCSTVLLLVKNIFCPSRCLSPHKIGRLLKKIIGYIYWMNREVIEKMIL